MLLFDDNKINMAWKPEKKQKEIQEDAPQKFKDQKEI